MQIVLDVIDSMTSAPLPGATIAINGQAVGMTDTNGVYIFDSNGSEEITVSYVGYSDYKIAAGILEGSGQIQMARATDQLPTVTVTPSPKKTNLLPWVLGAGLLFVATDKKHSISGTKKNNTGLIIGLGALGLGAIYFMTRSAPTTPTAGLTTQQLIALRAQQANAPISSGGAGASSWLSAGASLVSSLKDLFGGSGGSDNTTPGYYGADPLPAPPPDYYAPVDPSEAYV